MYKILVFINLVRMKTKTPRLFISICKNHGLIEGRYCGTLQVICCNKRILIIVHLRRVVQILYSSMVLRNTLHNQTKDKFVITNELTYEMNTNELTLGPLRSAEIFREIRNIIGLDVF